MLWNWKQNALYGYAAAFAAAFLSVLFCTVWSSGRELSGACSTIAVILAALVGGAGPALAAAVVCAAAGFTFQTAWSVSHLILFLSGSGLIALLCRRKAVGSEAEKLELRAILKNLPVGVVVVSQERAITFHNSCADKLLGLEADEDSLQFQGYGAFHSDTGALYDIDDYPVIRSLREDIAIHSDEVSVRRPEGGLRLEVSSSPVRDRHGKVRAAVMICQDVTERRRALERSEHRYRSLVTATAQIVWTTGPKGGFEDEQPSWSAFTGQTWEACRRDGSREMIHPDDWPRVEQEWRAGVQSGKSFEVGYRLWHAASGEYRECVSRGVPLLDSAGNIQEWVGTITDVHERKRLEEKLVHTAKLESLGVLAGGIAHDFNNLLTGILGTASFLLEEIPQGSPLHPLVKTLNSASERASDLTRQMLAYSGRGRFLLKVVNISRQVKLIGTLIRAAIPRHVELVWRQDPEPIYVEVDIAQLQQLVMNLVINAAEAIPDFPGQVTISTSRTTLYEPKETLIGDLPAGKYALIEVRDNGTGMDERTRHRIFDPFFTTKFTGRGLGLAAALGIVRAHHGGLELETAPGAGSTFRIYLCVSETRAVDDEGADDEVVDDAVVDEETLRRPEPAVVENGSTRKTILVVDDEHVVIDTAKDLLHRCGFKVVTAFNGLEALETLNSSGVQVDAVLLDVAMPVMGGVETARRIRLTLPALPIVIMSGYDEQEALRRFPDTPHGFLQKPFKLNDLEVLLTSLFSRPVVVG